LTLTPLRVALAGGLLAALATAARPPAPAAYAPAAGDTLRDESVGDAGRDLRGKLRTGAVLPGYFSARGLPPRAGQLLVTDSGVVFRAAGGEVVQASPLVGPLRTLVGGRPWRATTVELAYVADSGSHPTYLIRVEGSVFATDAPGVLLDLVGHPAWLDRLASREWTPRAPLAASDDSAAILAVARRIESSRYADTLYALFGRPTRPVGLVGLRGRRAGRLGEYIARRDSLALDPARIVSEEQLRHAMAHELGHRWQSRAPAQVRALWRDVPPIPDRRRYGHDNTAEHQAEAVAFAVDYLQTTAVMAPGPEALDLLERYEVLVPGTRLLTRYLALQPVYARHPMRRLLLGGPRPA
jgi:hypothetical protein